MGFDHIFLPDPDAKLSCQQKIYHYMLRNFLRIPQTMLKKNK